MIYSREDITYTVIASFTLDYQCAFVVCAIEDLHKGRPIHLAGTYDDFLSPGSRHLGFIGIFDVNLLEVGD